MPVYAADIAGRPTAVFGARNQAHALAFVNDAFIRSELNDLRTPDGGPLWDGVADVTIRLANADELAIWERNLFEDMAEGVHESREDAVESNGFAFLVEYREPDE